MEKLDISLYEQAFLNYKQQIPFFAIIGSVLEQMQGGIVLTDSNLNPTSFFIIHKFGFSQYFEITRNKEFEAQIISLLSTEKKTKAWDIPQKIRIYAPNQQFFSHFGKNQIKHIQRSERVQMRLPSNFTSPNDQLDNVEVIEAKDDFDRLNQELDLELHQRFWDSKASFIHSGLGCFSQPKGIRQVASLCYAAAISNQIAEIDVLTAEMYRKKGFASIAANAFINRCLDNQIIPNWDCFTNNLPSLNLAKKLGFKQTFVYDFYTINFN